MIKPLEIRTSVLFNLNFANNTVLSCLFFFFSIIDLYFVIAAVIAQIFDPIAELVIPSGIPTKEAKAEMEWLHLLLMLLILMALKQF